MSRWKAAGLHLGVSLIIATFVASVIYFLWYPPPYFQVAGGINLILLVMSVDVVLGPCLTLAVFRAGKRGLKFDLATIALLQTVAFCYGIYVVAAARPVFLVAVVDRFVPVSAADLDPADLAKAEPEYSTLSWAGPRLVGVVVPKKGTFELVTSAAAGKDVEKMPDLYTAYENVMDGLIAHAKPIDDLLKKNPGAETAISKFVAMHDEQREDVVYVPLQGKLESFAMALSKKTKRPIGALPLEPW